MTLVGHFINGEIIEDRRQIQNVYNPATGAVSKQVALADQVMVERAITAAQAAFPVWRNTPPMKRARVMFRFRELLESNADKIVAMITEEHGKVISDARVEPVLADAPAGEVMQFERLGYFVPDGQQGALVFNRAVTLRDSWGSKRG